MTRPTACRPRPAALARRLAAAAMAAALLLSACGKKAPPLPPLVRLPARPEPFAARRLGSVVFVQFQIPSTNTDGTTPADIERVEVYGLTGQPPASQDFFTRGTLVATVPVRKPGEPAREPVKDARPGQPAARPETWPARPPGPAASMATGFDQGDTVVVTEPIGPAQLAAVVAPPRGPAQAAASGKPSPPARFYVAVGVSRKGRKGAVSAHQSVLLAAPPSAPSEVTVTYTETAFTIGWTPPADARPPAAAGAPAASPESGALPPATGAFNVYEAPPPPAEGARVIMPPAARGQMPTPLNPAPVPSPPFVDGRMAFGQLRCYQVRAVTLVGGQAIEGDPSPVQCVSPVDTFPPAAPTSLSAVGSEGAISLIWEANKEPDLAGYLVLRAVLPGSEFVQLTPQPIPETTFTDTTALRGVRCAFVVIAVDASGNRSARSNRVEEAAR